MGLEGAVVATAKLPVPTEAQEQKVLAQWLDAIGVLWCHVPNGEERNARVGAKLKAMGVKPGVPDVLIFDPPAELGSDSLFVGTAIELKRSGRPTHGTRDQEAWLDALWDRGWWTAVCSGAEDAIGFLRSLGYGSRRD